MADNENQTPPSEGESVQNPLQVKALRKKGIIIASVFGGTLAVLLIVVLTIGFQLLNQSTESPSATWYKTVAGFYDENGEALEDAGSFEFLKIDNEDTPYYELTGITLNEDGVKTLVLPSKHQGEEDTTSYSVYVIPDFSSGTNIFGDTSYEDSISAIYVDGFLSDIGGYSFSGMAGLKSVYLGSSSSYSCAIGGFAFADDPVLQTVSMSRSAVSLAEGIFMNDAALKSLDLSDTAIASLGSKGADTPSSGAFQNCSSLSTLILPSTLTSIGDNSFYGDASLTSITYQGTSDAFQSAVANSENWKDSALKSVVCSDATIDY